MLVRHTAALLERDPGPVTSPSEPPADRTGEAGHPQRFVPIKPGGRRRAPIGYDPNGYFVITLDRAAGQIVVHHYQTDNTPGHQMHGHAAEPVLAGLLREDLITQLSHAGYLGAELAKAESALRLGLRYEQDRPLRA
jgi:tetrahydromethanopterin S-methyltransferase subunit A